MRVVRWLIAIVIAAIICWLFPLFHIVPLKTVTAEKVAMAFNATGFAESFWTNQLVGAMSKAVKAEVLIPAIQAGPAAAKTNYSRTVGMGDAYFYFISGTGRVLAVSDDEVSLAVTSGATNAEVTLETGLVFGNAIRDGTGLLNANDYPNSQDFNDLSAALNHIVETRVLPKVHDAAKVGATISFTGCAEVDDESSDLKPLKVIPIRVDRQGGTP
jgi:predicted lipoprotein